MSLHVAALSHFILSLSLSLAFSYSFIMPLQSFQPYHSHRLTPFYYAKHFEENQDSRCWIVKTQDTVAHLQRGSYLLYCSLLPSWDSDWEGVLEPILTPVYQYESQYRSSPSLRTRAIVRQLRLWNTVDTPRPLGSYWYSKETRPRGRNDLYPNTVNPKNSEVPRILERVERIR